MNKNKIIETIINILKRHNQIGAHKNDFKVIADKIIKILEQPEEVKKEVIQDIIETLTGLNYPYYLSEINFCKSLLNKIL